MRIPFAAALTLLAACASQPQATIRTNVEERVRIDGLSGEEVKLEDSRSKRTTAWASPRGAAVRWPLRPGDRWLELG